MCAALLFNARFNIWVSPSSFGFWGDWRLSLCFCSAHQQHSSVLLEDCYGYLLFANITIRQTSTIHGQFHPSETWDDSWVDFLKCLLCSETLHVAGRLQRRGRKAPEHLSEKTCSCIRKGGGYFLSFLDNVTWLHHYEVPLKSVGRSSHYSNTHYTDSPYSSFHSGLCPTKGSTLQRCTKHRACTFPCKSHKCIDSSRFFSCVFLCMFKTQFRLPVYSVKVFWGCLEKCWIHFLYIHDTKAIKLFESVRLVTCLAWPDKKHLPVGNLTGKKPTQNFCLSDKDEIAFET